MTDNLKQHKSSSYAPRTYHNASQGITLAVAIDHNTAGERLTQKAAGDKIVKIQWGMDGVEAARELYKKLKKYDCYVLNVAGNGIYTWKRKGITQEKITQYIYDIISLVHKHWPLEKIVSGGQTGADIAGLIVADALSIPYEGMWPNGYKMRWGDGKDVDMSLDEIKFIIKNESDNLKEKNK